MIRLNTNSRVNLNQLSSLKIGNNRGDLVPLETIAKFEQAQDARFLKRVDYKPARTVTASIDERTMTVPKANAVVDQTFASISKDFPEVSLTFSGAGKNTQDSVNSLFAALVLSLIGIFALLVFLFKSYLKPVLVMSTIPMGFLGISIAFNLHNLPLSFMALVGIVGLGGIIVNSGIVLISFIEELRKRGAQDLHTILVQASGMRLRAVVVTAFTTISGLLPTAYGIGGSDEFIIPMTMSMAWGMVRGTILALLWVPVGYAILEDITFFWNRVLAKLGIVKKEEAGSTPAEPTLESEASVAKAQSN